MMRLRGVATGFAGLAAMLAAPASAQFYFKPKDVSGAPVKGDEPGVVLAMPGATDAETRAGLVWSMRSALNVAALQCDFEPTLLTVPNYNAVLFDHKAELKNAFDTLAKYFMRTKKTKGAGQSALDQYGTRTYSSFATVTGQFGFCQTAASIGRQLRFTPRGGFGDVAAARMRELRNSTVPWGEQQFPRWQGSNYRQISVPRLDADCWTSAGQWNSKKCGSKVTWVSW